MYISLDVPVMQVSFSCFVIDSSGREVQPVIALYPKVRLSTWRQVRKNIHSRVWTPCPTWSVLHPGGPPSWFPQFPVTRRYGPHPLRLIRTSVQGGYPWYHLISSPPRKAPHLVLLTPRLVSFPATQICPLLSRPLYWNSSQELTILDWKSLFIFITSVPFLFCGYRVALVHGGSIGFVTESKLCSFMRR